MAATPQIFETLDSQSYRKTYAGGDLTAEWVVWYEPTLAAAEALLWATIATTLNTGYGSLEVKSVAGRNLGAPDLWLFTVLYGSSAANGAYRPDQLTVRVGTNTAHITSSLLTTQRLSVQDMGVGGVNLTVDATNDTVVTPVPAANLTGALNPPDGWVPQATDVGQTITIATSSGAGWSTGPFTVIALTTTTIGGKTLPAWQLSASPAAVGTAGGVWSRGADVASGTNLTVDVANNLKVTPDPAAWTPIAGDVGRQVMVVGGTGFTPGLYTITAVAGGEWTLSASPAAVGTANGTWYLVGTAPSYNGAIGVTRDTVQGCDIVVPACEFTLSQSVASMTDALIRTLRALVGTINSAPFNGYPTGTLLYLGFEPTSGEGSMTSGQNFAFWNLAHRFRYEPDVYNVQIGSIRLPFKPGHSYLWARYQPVAAGNVLTVPPAAVYVEQVYPYGNFATLGITI